MTSFIIVPLWSNPDQMVAIATNKIASIRKDDPERMMATIYLTDGKEEVVFCKSLEEIINMVYESEYNSRSARQRNVNGLQQKTHYSHKELSHKELFNIVRMNLMDNQDWIIPIRRHFSNRIKDAILTCEDAILTCEKEGSNDK